MGVLKISGTYILYTQRYFLSHSFIWVDISDSLASSFFPEIHSLFLVTLSFVTAPSYLADSLCHAADFAGRYLCSANTFVAGQNFNLMLNTWWLCLSGSQSMEQSTANN